MDLRRASLPPGPYRLSFELNGGTIGGGELFFTTDLQTILPKGKRIPFAVAANGKWQSIDIALETNDVDSTAETGRERRPRKSLYPATPSQ